MSFRSKLTSVAVFLLTMLQSSFAFVIRTPMRMLSSSAPLGMKSLPKGVVKYSQVPKGGRKFSKDTIPRGLLKEHTTKAGTWGVINVSQGRLRYQINEPRESVHIIDTATKGIIEPQVKHQVEALSDDLEFVVEFYRLPGTGPVAENREGLEE